MIHPKKGKPISKLAAGSNGHLGYAVTGFCFYTVETVREIAAASRTIETLMDNPGHGSAFNFGHAVSHCTGRRFITKQKAASSQHGRKNGMKILVTGACGQLGFDVIKELNQRSIEALATDILPEASGLPQGLCYLPLDLTDPKAVRNAIAHIRPDAVIHCAAWTAVDAAEEPENREKVFAINARGTRNLAAACKEIGAKMLYISTDYVFDGRGVEPSTCTR